MFTKPYDEMTKKEKLQFFNDYLQVLGANDEPAIQSFSKFYPIHPDAAQALKNAFGAEYLRQGNFNLSRAEVEYGKNWLDG